MRDHFGKHAREPQWLEARQLRRGAVSEPLRRWLLDSRSLTRRLKEACAGNFSVEILSQRWERPMLREARALGIPIYERCLVRQVRLLCDGSPWVFARTVIPLRSVQGRQRRLLYLRDRPLGEVLFADPEMRRDPVEVACLMPGHRLFFRALGTARTENREVWGRRSVFRLSGRSLLVSEFFLPQLQKRIHRRP